MGRPKLFGTLFERVMSKVEKPDHLNENGCWLYQGNRDHKRYGCVTVRVSGKPSPTRKRVHVIVWEEFHGPLPKGMTVDHLDCCIDYNCCNIDHLDPEPVTRSENTRRAAERRKNRAMQTE
jgi:hypothetical protein